MALLWTTRFTCFLGFASNGKEAGRATKRSRLEAGHGIIRTSVILVCGFSMLWFADYQPIQTLGFMLPVTLTAAVLLDLTVMPAMAQLGLLEPKIDASNEVHREVPVA